MWSLPSQDVSGDGIQTPKLLIVIGGDAHTLEWVRNGLDDKDPATLTAAPRHVESARLVFVAS